MSDPHTSGKAVPRHDLIDRLYHWVMAAAVFILMGTAFLPKFGIKFEWLTAHWISGIVLGVIVVLHIFRAIIWQNFMAMVPDGKDIVGAWRTLVGAFADTRAPAKPGKYNVAQKFYHLGIAIVILTLMGTGGAMLFKIDTPFWKRNPYVLTDEQWGLIYTVHGFAAMGIVAMIMIHIYFALRPDEWHLTRTMFRGWMTRKEYESHHDTLRWVPDTEK